MKQRMRLMEVDKTERAAYLAGLRSTYGEEILPNDEGMLAAHQRNCEALRHRLNSRMQPEAGGIDRDPHRLLVCLTQRCTFACSHCWVFASPLADCGLGLDELDAIHRHTSTGSVPRWTVSGGEFFTVPHFDEILKRYPIDCVFTNGFWGYPRERCRRYVGRIAAALRDSPRLRDGALTFILSYDSYHVEAGGRDLPLAAAIAGIIAEFHETIPQVNLRISHARSSAQDSGYRDVISALEQEGFSISQTARLDHNGTITTLSYHYQKQAGPVRELFVDTYPITPICRALLHHPAIDPGANARPPVITRNSPRARYQYALGPDGGVGLYQILYAPPVPYWLGDLVHEPWDAIAARADLDPIAITLDEDGIGPILSFMDRYYPALMRSLAPAFSMTQQFLYLVLLDPDRRLLLNAYLLRRVHELGRLGTMDEDLLRLVRSVLASADAGSRQSGLRELYDSRVPVLVP